MKVKVVTAFVPLDVRHATAAQYKALGDRLVAACGPENIRVFDNFPFEDCWAANLSHLPPASAVPSDRYATPADMVRSNIVQHQRSTWAMLAAAEQPDVDVWVWLDYGILKQGDFTGRPVTEPSIMRFLEKVRTATVTDVIPFPAIWGKGPISDTDVNWRFVGSTHIWPTKYLPAIHAAYQKELLKFVTRTGTVPNDLPIWAHVEADHPDLPFVSYNANHDATQVENFRGHAPETPLCEMAVRYQTDKGPYHGYTPVYYDMFKDYRDQVQMVLEVGIGWQPPGHEPYWKPGASLRMWEEFFPNARIFGLDIAPEVFVNEGRIKSSYGDQSLATSLVDAVHRMPSERFDFIVDDGSHILEHQILTMCVLLPYLREDGYYVIEDVNQDPRTIETRLPPGYRMRAVRSHSEPLHAYLVVIERV